MDDEAASLCIQMCVPRLLAVGAGATKETRAKLSRAPRSPSGESSLRSELVNEVIVCNLMYRPAESISNYTLGFFFF
jgi:hypothetical protein